MHLAETRGEGEPFCSQRELGGKVPRTHPKSRDCSHRITLSVIAGGVEAVICEDCGNVTIRYESLIAGDISRAQFSRKADTQGLDVPVRGGS